MHFQKATVVLIVAAFAGATPVDNTAAGPDINCVTTSQRQTALVGDGTPHQNFVYKQVSGTTDCTNNPSGGASVTESETVTYTLSIAGAADFITGGFSVSDAFTTGFTNSFGCATTDGSIDGDLCVFERVQVTAYTVDTRTCVTSSCGGTTCGDYANNVVIYAPNSDQPGCFYDNIQVNLPCDGIGSEHYVYDGPAGGPQTISC